MKLGIGTAQFGLSYGISNNLGITPENEIFQILNYAASVGIETIDTASGYGNAEVIISRYLNQYPDSKFKVVSKFKDETSIAKDAKSSLTSLRSFLYGYLAHTPQTIINNSYLRDVLQKLRKENDIKIGVSVYDQAEIEQLLEYDILDLVQVPLNVLDHRLIKSGILSELKSRGIEVHARSVFLQGLFFLNEEEIEKNFASAHSKLLKIKNIGSVNNLTISDLALLFVNSINEIDKIIVGVNNLSQLEMNVYSLRKKYNNDITKELINEINFNDQRILNPSLW